MKTIFIFLFFTSFSYACTCIEKNNIKNDIKKSDVIVMGEIIQKKHFEVDLDSLPKEFSLKFVEYTVAITRTYKGDKKLDTINIITGIGNGDCGIKFSIGQKYIIYGMYSNQYSIYSKEVDRFVYSDICMRTKLYDRKEEKKIEKYFRKQSRW